MDDQQLKIVISAIDNASAVLKQMAENTDQASKDISKSTQTSGQSFTDLVGTIVTAQAAYNELVKLKDVVVGFFKDSIDASIEQEATMAQVRVNIQNAGLSYADLGPKIDEVSAANERLGFENNDTSLSISKLVLATGSYNDALKLNQLAMDLARAKGIDLNSATVLLQQVMAGNTRVMKQYGISLDSATTSGEALDLLQSKLQGSASAFADTTAGRLQEMQAQWARVEEQVGDKFSPVIQSLFDSFESNLPEITQDLEIVAENIAEIGKVIGPVFLYISDSMKMARNSIQVLTDALDVTSNDATRAAVAQGKLYEATHNTADATKDAATATAAAGQGFDDIANHINAADNAVVKHDDAVAKLSTEYDKLKDSGATDLATLSDDFTKSMKTIDDAIAATTQKIADLKASYAQQQKDDTSSVADTIVASEMKIADLKAQLAKATTADQITNLNDQLTAEQKNYDSSYAFRLANADAIAAAEARAKETDLQRTIDDYNAKEKLAQDDYNSKLAQLQQELADKQKESSDEIALYQQKTTAINKVMNDAQVYFNKLSAERVSTTTAEVQAEIAQFNALSAAISAMKSASASALGTITVPTLPGVSTTTPAKHEAGGFVNAPRGTAVPIIAHGGEEVIPAELSGKRGGSTIVVTINNPSVRSEDDLDSMRKMIDEVLRPLLLNSKIAHV